MHKITRNKNHLVQKLAWCSLAGQASFLFLTVLLHFLRPDYDPLSRFVSEYAVGKYSLLMVLGFEVLGFGSLALTAALTLDSASSSQKHSRSGIIGLGVWSISVVVVGLVPTNLKNEPFTTSAIIHGVASMLAFISLISAAFLLANGFKHSRKWSTFYHPALWLARLMLLTLLAFFASPSEFKGLSERGLVLTLIVWLSLVSFGLARQPPVKTGA
jgi:hypothetical protein